MMNAMLAACLLSTLCVALASEPYQNLLPPFLSCMPGMKCFKLSPYDSGIQKSWEFDCATVNSTLPGEPKGDVYFMHGNDGGGGAKGMWTLMMQGFADAGYNTLACDQRGYSPGASPYDSDYYNYDYLAEDIFAIADEYFGAGKKFHVVAHDQGARLGWHSIAVGTARTRYLSYTALSEAHSDAFSDALYGPNPDAKQQLDFEYLWQFTLPGNSTRAYYANIWNQVCKVNGYETPEACQPAIWWYIGAVKSGNLAMMPLSDFGPIGTQIGIPVSFVKEHTPYPLEGQPQKTKVGMVSEFPVYYVCGAGDLADSCNDRFKDETAKYITNFKYYRSEVCGHDLVSPKKCNEYQKITEQIVAFVEAATDASV